MVVGLSGCMGRPITLVGESTIGVGLTGILYGVEVVGMASPNAEGGELHGLPSQYLLQCSSGFTS